MKTVLYRYPDPRNKRVFILIGFDKSKNALFKCGHKVTDNVFLDMVRVDGQLELF